MLTILAWVVFVPAISWNILFFSIAFADFMMRGSASFSAENLKQAIISLAALFIPGVYLFGWL